MFLSLPSRFRRAEPNDVASVLTEQQHLFPHRSLRLAVRAVAERCGLSAQLADAIVSGRASDGVAIGRLTRLDINELADRLGDGLPRSSPVLPRRDRQGSRAA